MFQVPCKGKLPPQNNSVPQLVTSHSVNRKLGWNDFRHTLTIQSLDCNCLSGQCQHHIHTASMFVSFWCLFRSELIPDKRNPKKMTLRIYFTPHIIL